MLKRAVWAVAVVLVANIAALLGVAADRRGQPDSVLVLTERELRVAESGTDTTGMTLALQWNRETSREWVGKSGGLPWFDRAKLASIGFDCSIEPNAAGALEHYSGPAVTPRTTYLVFEYEASGDAALDASASPQAAASQPESAGGAAPQANLAFRSRLRPIDAGNDPLALRAKYRDRHRYLVTAGSVRLRIVRAAGLQPARLDGLILDVLPSQLYVPRELQRTIAPLLGKDGSDRDPGPALGLNHPPRYEVTVEYGRHLLPRVVGARALTPTAAAR